MMKQIEGVMSAASVTALAFDGRGFSLEKGQGGYNWLIQDM